MQLSRSARISIVSLYWSAVALGSLALLFSMVTTLWGQHAPASGATLAERRTWCVGQLAMLHAELEHETQAALGPYHTACARTAKRRQSWQRSFGERLESVQAQCTQPEALRVALTQLSTLFGRYDGIVVTWKMAQDSLHAPIESALAELVKPWPQPLDETPPAP